MKTIPIFPGQFNHTIGNSFGGISYSISGTVYDGDGTTPIPNATIALGPYTGVSAADGTYTISDIPPATSGSLTCTLTGYSWTAITVAAMSGNLTGQNFTAKFWNGGALVAWFDFSDIITLFQDAAGTTPVTADAQSIRNVTDKSGNSNKLTNAGGAATVPTYRVNIQNSLSGVLGEGGINAKNLRTAAFSSALSVPTTCIMTIRNDVLAVNEFYYDGLDGTHRHTTWNGASGRFSYYSGGVVESLDVTAGPSLISTVYGAPGRIRRNGAQIKSGNSQSQTLTGLTLLNDSTLGYPLTNGYMLELLFYTGDITDTCIGYTESYLNTKWAIY